MVGGKRIVGGAESKKRNTVIIGKQNKEEKDEGKG